MKDYSATISVTIGFQAPNDDKAQERAEDIADRLTIGPDGQGKTTLPAWYDDNGWGASVEDVTCESE